MRIALSEPRNDKIGYRNRTVGTLGNKTVTLLEAGIGVANTAQALTAAIHDNPPDVVMQIGVGGAYLSSPLKIGDIAIATSESYGNLGVITQEGWQSSEAIGIPLLQSVGAYFNTFPIDATLVTGASDILKEEYQEINIHSGPFVTVEQCSGLASVGNELAERFGAICENMEGAAAAQICKLYDIPFLELRGISNAVEDRNRNKWDLLGASRVGQSAAKALIENWPTARAS